MAALAVPAAVADGLPLPVAPLLPAKVLLGAHL